MAAIAEQVTEIDHVTDELTTSSIEPVASEPEDSPNESSPNNEEEINEVINIEEIMQQIRQQIMARRANLTPDGRPPVIVTGKRFSPEFYEHLYQARLAEEQFAVPIFVSRSSLPLIGRLIDWVRGKFHELVVYYVNQSATQQIHATGHLLQALSMMAQELEAAENDRRPPTADH
jgi:hypothetical protein